MILVLEEMVESLKRAGGGSGGGAEGRFHTRKEGTSLESFFQCVFFLCTVIRAHSFVVSDWRANINAAVDDYCRHGGWVGGRRKSIVAAHVMSRVCLPRAPLITHQHCR